MNIQAQIKKIRSEIKLSQSALGKAIGTNRDDIKDIENGRKRCTADTYLKIIKLRELLYPEKEKEGA